MVHEILWWTLWLWCVWIFAHLAAMLLARLDIPYCNGLQIFIPNWCAERLTPVELHALYLHEVGHLRAMHVWKNFALVCIFMRVSWRRRWEQELEADDFAAGKGFGFELASALSKLSANAHDNVRARRLLLKGSRDVSNPLRAGCVHFKER